MYDYGRDREPDIVIIDLGVNDAKLKHWDEEAFISTYVELIEGIKAWES